MTARARASRAMSWEALLYSQGFGSRRECRALILTGRVGHGAHGEGSGIVSDPGAPVVTGSAQALIFRVDEQVWTYHEKAYLMLHKPAGYECSRTPSHHPSVFSLLPAPLLQRGVQCVGRLDQDTTGLLLLSDDGQFVHAMASPKKDVAKTYEARVRHPIDAEQLSALREGVLLHGEAKTCRAKAAQALSPTLLELSISEGKYHQVKRMVAAVGNHVDALHRRSVGALALPATLAPGHWQWLDATAILALKQPTPPTPSTPP